MKKQVIIFIILLNISGIFHSCLSEICNDFEFFIYDGIETIIDKPIIIEQDSLKITVTFLEPDFTAFNSKFETFSNTLKAQADCDKGWGGDKFPITRISIKSDSDFTELLESGAELKNIFKAWGTDSIGEYKYSNLSSFAPKDINTAFLYLTDKPTMNQSHNFSIEFEKSNGEIVTAVTQTVTWQ